MLRLVIPKGSLEEQTLRLLEAADLGARRGSSRDYHGSIETVVESDSSTR